MEILKIVGQVAGIGGLSIGLIILVFRDILRQKFFPRLTKAQAFRVIRMIIICTWSVAIVGICAWVITVLNTPPAVAATTPIVPRVSLQSTLLRYGSSTLTVLDLTAQNENDFPQHISKVKLLVGNVYEYRPGECHTCYRELAEGKYSIPINSVVEGVDEYLVSHTIKPKDIERISLVLGSSNYKSYLAEITLQISFTSGAIAKTKQVYVLVENQDISHQTAHEEINSMEIAELVDSKDVLPLVITKKLIKVYFEDSSDSGWVREAPLPPLPEWAE